MKHTNTTQQYHRRPQRRDRGVHRVSRLRIPRSQALIAIGITLLLGAFIGGLWVYRVGSAYGIGPIHHQSAAVFERVHHFFPEAYEEKVGMILEQQHNNKELLTSVQFYAPAGWFGPELAPKTAVLETFHELGTAFNISEQLDRQELRNRAQRLARSLAPPGQGACANVNIDEPKRISFIKFSHRLVRQISVTLDFSC